MSGSSPVETADRRRDDLAQDIFLRLNPLMGWLAAVFILVLVGDAIVAGESPYSTIFVVAGWVIWGIFVLDFVTRLALAPSTGDFLRRNWWQILFLVLPFLAFFRFFIAVRVARAGRLLSAAVRGTRSAAANLRDRLTTVAAVTVIVILLSANVLFEFGGIRPYGNALHAAALATISGEPTSISGEPTSGTSAVAQLLDVLLALYSVVIFAAVAGTVGAFFLERRAEDEKSRREPLLSPDGS